MNIGISLETDLQANKKAYLIHEFSDFLSNELNDIDYGTDVKSVYIGLICLKPIKGFEEFFKVRKPKYSSYEEIDLFGGGTKIIKNSFSYDFKFDEDSYIEFVNSNNTDALNVVKRNFLQSLVVFDSLSKKIKDFDLDRFKSDITRFIELY